MNSYLPVLVGGVLPAVLWGMTAVFQKASAAADLGPGRYLMVFGAVICTGGLLYARLIDEAFFTVRGTAFAALAGLLFALGTGLLSYALWKFDLPIAKAAPILGANVLIPVLVGTVFMGEHAELDLLRLLIGTGLVLVGSIIVTSA